MFVGIRVSRHILPGVLFAALLSGLPLPSPVRAQALCETALSSQTGGTTLVHDQTTSEAKGPDEWESDILKITAPSSGLLDVDATGPGAQGRLYTGNPNAGTFGLVNVTSLGTGHRVATSVAQGQTYCIEVSPGAGAIDDITLRVKFRDACLLGQPDDHGDSFSCATAATVGGSNKTGEIAPSDHDVFAFELGSTATVSLESSGSTDVAATLFEEDGTLIDDDDDSGSGSNFLLSQSLPAGRYYLRVESSGSAQGSYTLSLSSVP
jgi:hypothetical protein